MPTKQVMDKVDKVLELAKDYKRRGLWADKNCVTRAMYSCIDEGDKDWGQIKGIAEGRFKKFCEGIIESEKNSNEPTEGEVKRESGKRKGKESEDPRVIEGGLFGENFRKK